MTKNAKYLIVYIVSGLTFGSRKINAANVEGFVASPRDPDAINQLQYNNYSIISKLEILVVIKLDVIL